MTEGSRQVTVSARVDQQTVHLAQPVLHRQPVYWLWSSSSQCCVFRPMSHSKQLRPKVDYIFEFKIYNDGNNRDQFIISVSNRDDLADSGFQISLPEVNTWIESKAPPQKMRVMMRTPKKQGWSDHYYQLDFKATSEHSIRAGGVEMSQTQMVTLYIRGVYLPGFQLIPSLMMLGLPPHSSPRDAMMTSLSRPQMYQVHPRLNLCSDGDLTRSTKWIIWFN